VEWGVVISKRVLDVPSSGPLSLWKRVRVRAFGSKLYPHLAGLAAALTPGLDG
jgi:hypothetical protein